MPRTAAVLPSLLIAVAFLASCSSATAPAPVTDPVDAQQLLQRALAASGAEAAPPVTTFVAEGTYYAREQAPNPAEEIARAERRYRYIIDLQTRRLRREAELLYPGGIRFSTLAGLDANGGFQVDRLRWRQGTDLTTFSATEAQDSWLSFNRFLPHLALLQARDGANLELIATAAAPTIRYRDARDTEVTIEFRADGLPARVAAKPAAGPPSENTYDAYDRIAGVAVPGRIAVALGGRPLEEVTVRNVALTRHARDAEFAMPDGYSAPPAPSAPSARMLADGVYFLENMPGGYHSLFIDGPDGITLLEAPLSPQYSEKAIEVIRRTLPGKEVRRVFVTHHHGDHTGGLLPYATAGAEIVVGSGADIAIRRQLDARSAGAGAKATLRVVTDRTTIQSGELAIEAIPLSSTHSAPTLLLWLPASRILFQGDLLYVPDRGEVPAAFPVTAELDRALRALGIAPRLIVGVHGRPATPDDVRRSLELASVR
jgi:glyoxylase-like metal-dependent hydrolase (beta-lactamase superfamily II)